MHHISRRHESAAEQALDARLGYRNQEDFEVGDRVMTPDGYEGTVTDVFEGYQGDSYDVVLDGGLGGGEYRGNDLQRTARRYSDVPLACDKCGRTATTSMSGGKGGHSMLCPECADTRISPTAARAGAPLAAPGTVVTAADDYPELNDVLWTNPDHVQAVPVSIRNVSLGSKTAANSGSEFDNLVEDPNQPWLWRNIIGPAVQRVNDNLQPQYQTTDLSRGPSIDWCRFRRDSHCYFAKYLDEEGSQAAGYPVWIPEDRGPCPRAQHHEQKECQVAEPGPNSGEKLTFPDATYSWAQGGQRFDRKYSSKTGAWSDVNEKATRIRRDGGVRIISNTGATVTAEVHGDHHIYITTITRVPGGKGVGVWYCSCDWAKYAWDRSDPYKKYEGRKCAHATALLYEMQAHEMFGGEIHEVPEAPSWNTGEVRMERRDGQTPEEYGVQVYDLVTASLTLDEKLLAIGNMQDVVLAAEAKAQGEPRDRLSSFVAALDHARIGVSGADQLRRHGFSGQVGGRVVDTLELTPDGDVDTGSSLISPDRVLYPTYHPSLGLDKSSAGRSFLLGERSAGETKLSSMNEGLDDLLATLAGGEFTHAGLIIKAADSGRVLLTQRTPYHGDDEETYGKWEFPGGGLEEGEDPIDGAIREFTEETGLDLPDGYSIDDHYTNGGYVGIVITVPHETWIGDANLLDLETMGIGWFDPDDIEDAPWTRPELDRIDFDMVREASLGNVQLVWKGDGTHEVHAAGCRDLAKAERNSGYEVDPPAQFDTVQDIVRFVYPPENFGYDFDAEWKFYASDITILPCANNVLGSIGQGRVGAVLADSSEPVTSILLDSPEPVMDTGVSYGSEGDAGDAQYGQDEPDEDVGYYVPDRLQAAGAFVPGDARLAHLAPGAGDGEGGEDIAKAAAEFLSKTAVKTFTPAEQQMLIDEGAHGHIGASNTDRLQIEGTFYESAETDDMFW